jgi:putative endonuclease
MYHIYILKCSDGSLYTGSTNNVTKRLHAHNYTKSGAHYTKIRRPVELVYQEEYGTKSEALIREAEIKEWKKEKKLNLIYKLKSKDTGQ